MVHLGVVYVVVPCAGALVCKKLEGGAGLISRGGVKMVCTYIRTHTWHFLLSSSYMRVLRILYIYLSHPKITHVISAHNTHAHSINCRSVTEQFFQIDVLYS